MVDMANYINGDEVRITKVGTCLVDVEFYSGERFEGLEPRRLFPLSGLRNYITLLDSDLKEKAVIRDLDRLMPDSKKAIEDCLEEYYLIPRITAVLNIVEKFGVLKWTIMTDRGERTIRIKNRHSDIKTLYDGRILVRDANDNRYEIPDVSALDKHSQKLLSYEL